MIKNVTLGQYFPGESFLHSLDPRAKIAMTTIYIVALFLIDRLLGFAAVAGIILITIKACKLPLKIILRGLAPLKMIIIITVVINAMLTDGEVLFGYGRFTVTKEGLYFASIMASRLVLLVTGTMLLTLTTSPIALTDGIEKLLAPFRIIKVPAHEIAMMMTIALRFVPTLLIETERIMKAQSARGADFESGSLINKAKALVPLLVPLFVNSIRRADELAIAMEARCYRGGTGRTKLNPLVLKAKDYAVVFASAVILLSVALAERVGVIVWPI